MTARVTKENFIAVRIGDIRKFGAQEIIVAFVTDSEIVSKTLRTNMGTVAGNGERVFGIIFVAVLTKAKMLVEAVFTDVNNVAVRAENVPSFRAVGLALLTEIAVAVIAVVTVKSVRNFVTAGNAQAVSTNGKSLEVMGMVIANGNFGVKVAVSPVRITAEAVTTANTNVVFVVAIFFSLPKIGNIFKFGEFALNQIAIESRISLSSASTTVSIVKATLK